MGVANAAFTLQVKAFADSESQKCPVQNGRKGEEGRPSCQAPEEADDRGSVTLEEGNRSGNGCQHLW